MLTCGRKPPHCSSRDLRGRRLHARSRAIVRSSPGTETAKQQLLDSFWEARGVLDPVHRKLLVDAAEALDAETLNPLDTAPLSADAPLPGLPATWQLEQSAPEVITASRRLLALQQMLGGGLHASGTTAPASPSSPAPSGGGGSFGGFAAGAGVGGGAGAGGGGRGIDVVWMIVREPGLLSADLTQLTGRLLDMKLATYGMDVDVLKVVEAQPALLLSDHWRLDLESLQASSSSRNPQQNPGPNCNGTAPTASANNRLLQSANGSGPASVSSSPSTSTSGPSTYRAVTQGPAGGSTGAADTATSTTGAPDSVQQLVQAWQYGITSDGDREWALRLSQLSAYRNRHGDTCVGFRDGDDAELSRWSTKQRADRCKGQLAESRFEQLSALGFVFDADEAEWCRWFSELLAFKRDTGHCSPMPLVTGGDMYLINWCSVQRIARRSRVMSESRIQRLDEAGFDWTGADPLS